MNRREKYPETDVFHLHNENPKNRITGDCVYRAISRATGKGWIMVAAELFELAIETGYEQIDKKCYEKYLKKIGWIKHKQPRKPDGTKYTGAEFCMIAPKENIICRIGGHHLSCIIDGKFNDIWDCTDNCVNNYWTKIGA